MAIKALFVDIGGVVLTNGWDHVARASACQTFGLDIKELEDRHALSFGAYEIGAFSLEEYLRQVVFFTPRAFTIQQFIEFMHAQSKLLPDTLDMLHEIKNKYKLKVVAISNEGRELTNYRIQKFGLDRVFDFYVSSGFVGYRKPDFEIYELALAQVHVTPEEVLYIDDRKLFVEVGTKLGLTSIQHSSASATKESILKML